MWTQAAISVMPPTDGNILKPTMFKFQAVNSSHRNLWNESSHLKHWQAIWSFNEANVRTDFYYFGSAHEYEKCQTIQEASMLQLATIESVHRNHIAI